MNKVKIVNNDLNWSSSKIKNELEIFGEKKLKH